MRDQSERAQQDGRARQSIGARDILEAKSMENLLGRFSGDLTQFIMFQLCLSCATQFPLQYTKNPPLKYHPFYF